MTTINTDSISRFGIDVLKSSSSVISIQVLNIFLLPIIARLYGAEAFGLFAIFSSIWGPLNPFSTMHYHLAIMLPKSDKDAAAIVATNFGILISITVLFLFAIIIFKKSIIGLLQIDSQYEIFIFMTPIIIFLGGLFSILRYWNLREKRFLVISFSTITQFLADKIFIILAGLLGMATGANLIIGVIIGSITVPIILGYSHWRKLFALIKSQHFNFLQMTAVLKKYYKFPLFSMSNELFLRLSESVPILILSNYFSQSIVGFYFFSIKLLAIPLTFFGKAIGEVFFQRATHNNDKTIIRTQLLNLIQRIFFLGLPIFVILGILGEEIISFIFRDKWSESGIYIQILCFLMFIRLVTFPAKYLAIIFEKQEYPLFFSVINLFFSIIALYLGGRSGDIYYTVVLLTLLNGLGTSIYGLILFNLADISFSDLIKVSIRNIILILPIVFILNILHIFILLEDFQIILISLLLLVIYYWSGLKKDEQLRIVLKSLFKQLNPLRNV